jgi:hypothetical protein
MSDIPDLQELVVWHWVFTAPDKVSHPLAYVTVDDARRLIEMLKRQQEEIERLKGEVEVISQLTGAAPLWTPWPSWTPCEELAPGQCEEGANGLDKDAN